MWRFALSKIWRWTKLHLEGRHYESAVTSGQNWSIGTNPKSWVSEQKHHRSCHQKRGMAFSQGLKKEIVNTLLFCMTSSPHRKECLVQSKAWVMRSREALAIRKDQFTRRETKSLYVASIVDISWTTTSWADRVGGLVLFGCCCCYSFFSLQEGE